MKNIFNRMIKANQYAYLPKRSMNSAINYVRLRVENLKQKSQSHRFIVSLDFSKAFDRIDREYIIELLGAVGVPEILTTPYLFKTEKCECTKRKLISWAFQNL